MVAPELRPLFQLACIITLLFSWGLVVYTLISDYLEFKNRR